MKATTALIFLHGSGGNGPELRSFLESAPIKDLGYQTFRHFLDNGISLGSGDVSKIDLFTPTATRNNYTPMDNEKMNIWFDRSRNFIELGVNDKEDINGAEKSVNKVNRFKFY